MLTANRMRLAALTKTLLLQWDVTRDSWRDGRAQEFEQEYLKGLQSSVEGALEAMEELEAVLVQLRSDCE